MLENKKNIHELYEVQRKNQLFHYVTVNIQKMDPVTRFFTAIQTGDLQTVCTLMIAHGFDANVKLEEQTFQNKNQYSTNIYSDNETPLHHACRFPFVCCLCFFLFRKIKFNKFQFFLMFVCVIGAVTLKY